MALASSTSSTNHDYNVYVSAWQQGNPVHDDTLPTSTLFVTSKVMVSYQSPETAPTKSGNLPLSSMFPKSAARPPAVPLRFTDFETSHTFRFSSDSFNDGKQIVSTMISDMGIPFSLENNIQWRPRVHEAWTPLQSKDEIVNRILDVATLVFEEGLSSGTIERREFRMHVCIEKNITLPRQEYKSLVRDREEKRVKCAAMELLMGYVNGSAARNNSSAPELQWWLDERLWEIGVGLDTESLQTIVQQVIRKTAETTILKQAKLGLPKLLEKLEDVKYKGAHLCKMDKCSICRQETELNSYMKRLPRCGHLFHGGCIQQWLKRSPTCPNCRYSLEDN